MFQERWGSGARCANNTARRNGVKRFRTRLRPGGGTELRVCRSERLSFVAASCFACSPHIVTVLWMESCLPKGVARKSAFLEFLEARLQAGVLVPASQRCPHEGLDWVMSRLLCPSKFTG